MNKQTHTDSLRKINVTERQTHGCGGFLELVTLILMIKKIFCQCTILVEDDDGKNGDGEDDDGEDGTHLLRSLQGQHQGKCKHCCLDQART